MPKRSEKWARNKKAFDEIIGDPYGLEPIQGHYGSLKSRSSISIAGSEQLSPSPVNKARPSAVDFFCDVDACIEDGMSTMYKGAFDTFVNTYITETGPIFNQKERTKVEQLVGNILVERKIYPAARYFTTIK